jgi:glutathione synthase/RimK-type ligase-like ATP-grasp enzyme
MSMREGRELTGPPPLADSDYVGGKWTSPRPFVSLIDEAASISGASVRWLSEGWIARLEKKGEVRYVHGACFPLNNASAAHIAEDKVSTFTVLADARVAAMPHYLVRIPSSGELAGAADRALSLVRPPFVVKPTSEAGGLHVFRAGSVEEAHALIGRLALRYPALAVCPFETIVTEHRVVMLDDEPLLFFRKELNDQREWRHNLKHGARPVIEESVEVRDELTVIARQAMRAIGARFMTVDVIKTPLARKVLEINSGVMLDRFAAQGQAHRAYAVDVYRRAIGCCFTASRCPGQP